MKVFDTDIRVYYNDMISSAIQSSAIIKSTKNIFKKWIEVIHINIYMNRFGRMLKKTYDKDEYSIGDLVQLASLLHSMSKVYGNEDTFCVFNNDTWKFSYIIENGAALEFVVFHIERAGTGYDVKVDFKVSYRNNSDTNYILYQIESTKYNGEQIENIKHDEHTVKSIKVSGDGFKNRQEQMIGKMLGGYVDMLVDEMSRYTKEYMKNTYMQK